MTKEFTIKVNVPSGKVLTDVVEKTVNGETVFVPVFENKALFKPGDFIYNPETKRGGIFAAVRKNVLYVFVYDDDMHETVEDSVGKPSQWEHCSEEAITEYKKVLSKNGLTWNQEKLSYEKTCKEDRNPLSNEKSPYQNGDTYYVLTPHGMEEHTYTGSAGDHFRTLLPGMHAKTKEDLVKKIAEHFLSK